MKKYKTVSAVCRNLAKYFSKHTDEDPRWLKEDFEKGKALCTVQGLRTFAETYDLAYECENAMAKVGRLKTNVMDWNDAKRRKVTEVINLLEKTADAYDQKKSAQSKR
jgi:hypothetical protein